MTKRRRQQNGQRDLENEEDRIMPQFPQKEEPLNQDEEEDMKPMGNSFLNSQASQLDDAGEDDDVEDDDDDDDEMEPEMTPQKASQLEQELSNKGFAHSGILESVQLDRFMSHLCFEYKFGRNINIINGPNGSGKSAIVAALQIGLGARASATERGSKIEDHIMHGKNDAIITIRIHNAVPKSENGQDFSFKQERYGPKIIIERKLVRNGGSSFVIKDYRGRKPKFAEGESHRSEVRDLVDHFGFMVDNPVAILTQTKSKAFLAKCKPAQHYQLYKEATLLGPLENELRAIDSIVKDMRVEVDSKKKDYPRSQRILNKLRNAHEEAQAMKNIDEQVSQVEIRFAWTLHAESENDLKRYELKMNTEFIPEKEEAGKEYEELRDRLQQRDEAIQKMNQSAEAKLAEKNKLVQAAKKAKLDVKMNESNVRTHRSTANQCDEDVSFKNEQIEKIERDLERKRLEHIASQKQKAEMQRRIEDAIRKVQELENEFQEARKLESEEYNNLEKANEALPRIQREYANIENSYAQKRSTQMQIENTAANDQSIVKFGQDFVNLERAIDSEWNRGSFSERPVGPLGAFLKVKDQSWAAPIELCLGSGNLTSYIVNNARDARVLQDLVRRIRATPSIIIRSLRREMYTIGEQDKPLVIANGRQRCVLLDMLICEHAAVFNVLVDSNYIERTVLVGKQENGEIENVQELGWSNTRNLHTVWNLRGEHAYSRNGSNTYRRTPRNYSGRATILTRDWSAYKTAVADEVRRLGEKKNELAATLNEHKAKVAACKAKWEDAKRVSVSKQTELRNAKSEKESNQDFLAHATSAFNEDPFKNEIKQLREDIDELERKKAAALKWVQEATKYSGELKQRWEEAMKKAKALDNEHQSELDEIERSSQALGSIKRDMEAKYRVFARAEKRCAAGSKEIEGKKKEANDRFNNAQEFGPRPDDLDCVKLPASKVDKQLKALKRRKQLEQERHDGKSASEIEREYLVAKGNYEEQLKLLKRIEGYASAMEAGLKLRMFNKSQLEKILRKHIRAHFTSFLGVRGHSGNLHFKRNEKNGVLELFITTKMASHKSSDGGNYVTKDLRSLSGGERSFTTLAFMLALAEVCSNPIRVMDEIDVFQDEANRLASFRTLVDYCSRFLTDKQFIIITPLRLPGIEPSDFVRIQKLRPPRGDNSGQQAMDQYLQD